MPRETSGNYCEPTIFLLLLLLLFLLLISCLPLLILPLLLLLLLRLLRLFLLVPLNKSQVSRLQCIFRENSTVAPLTRE